MKVLVTFAVAVLFVCGELLAQTGAYKQINPYHKYYADSLKTMEYKPIFPLLGQKAYKKGYDIPLSYEVSFCIFV